MKRWLTQSKCRTSVTLAEDQDWSQHPYGSSQLSVTLMAGNPTPSDFCGHQAYTWYINIHKHNFLKKKNFRYHSVLGIDRTKKEKENKFLIF